MIEFERYGFIKLTSDVFSSFIQYYNKMKTPLPSSLHFTSINAWSHTVVTYYKPIGEHLVCFQWDAPEKRWVLIPFLGVYEQEKINAVMKEVLLLYEQWHIPLVLTDVAEWMRPFYEAIPFFNWEVTCDRDLSDYVYTAEDFCASLNEQKVRYDYRYFIRKYNPVLEIMRPEYAAECAAFIHENWCIEHNCEECVYGCAVVTEETAVACVDKTGANGIVVRIDGKMIAFCIVNACCGQGVFQFKKTQRGFRGINEYLHKECYDRFLSGVNQINYTEDMGQEGLRKYKCKLAPYTLYPRYEMRKIEEAGEEKNETKSSGITDGNSGI